MRASAAADRLANSAEPRHDGIGTPAARGAPATTSPADPCSPEREAAASACAAAETARDAARQTADRLRAARRGAADLQAVVAEAEALADPRRVAAEKDRLQARFRAADRATATDEEGRAAVRDWLTAASALNAAAAVARRRASAGREELARQAAGQERIEVEANAARIAAERAEVACRAARETLAACAERHHPLAPAPEPVTSTRDGRWPASPEPAFEREPPSVPAPRPQPAILRVLRGEADAREQLVARLSPGDPAETAAWHVRIARFVDAVVARAVEDGDLDLDAAHPFWRQFSAEEQTQIVVALAALGFRFDPLGGFADGRVPSARDVSLAVGYAGIDRARLRALPGAAELPALFAGAQVRADAWLARRAADLSLEHVEAALGPRAAGLADLWDAWGPARAAMLEAS